MHVPRKLLVLVLDAASPPLIREWAADGTLPNLANLMATGLVANTESLEGHYLGSPWPSFYTGLNAGRHGFSWLDRLQLGSYRIRPSVPADFAKHKTLWEILADAGRKAMVLDVPLCSLSRDFGGVQVLEWRSHDSVFGFHTTPRALKRSIVQRMGHHPAPASCDVPHRSLPEYRTFADQLIRGAALRARLTRQLLMEQPWEFAIQVFSESHCAGHQLWHYHDPTNPAFDAAVTREYGDLLREVYIALDAAIGAVLEGLDPGTTVVVLTLHGMSNMAGVSLLLPEILNRLGMTSPPLPTNVLEGKPLGNPFAHGLRSAYHLVPESFRATFWQLRSRLRKRWIDATTAIPIDPESSKCFPLALGPGIGGIRLNLRGREPLGTLTPGVKADQFCEQLTSDLMELIDPNTGQPVVTRVVRTAELFHGSALDELPDLLVEWNLAQPLGNTSVGTGAGARASCYSERTGLIEEVNEYGRTGEHRLGGMLIARGPGLIPRQLDSVVSNLDLAPTFAQFFGVEMPGVDGRPVLDLLR